MAQVNVYYLWSSKLFSLSRICLGVERFSYSQWIFLCAFHIIRNYQKFPLADIKAFIWNYSSDKWHVIVNTEEVLKSIFSSAKLIKLLILIWT